jgi:hypothetical protein
MKEDELLQGEGKVPAGEKSSGTTTGKPRKLLLFLGTAIALLILALPLD